MRVKWGYVDFFFQLNLLPPYSLRSQGENMELCLFIAYVKVSWTEI